jgi:hypothetical protein
VHGFFWSIERCAWQPSPGRADALVTPWSAHDLPVPALPFVKDADAVLRLPSREAVAGAAVPDQRTAATPVPAT